MCENRNAYWGPEHQILFSDLFGLALIAFFTLVLAFEIWEFLFKFCFSAFLERLVIWHVGYILPDENLVAGSR